MRPPEPYYRAVARRSTKRLLFRRAMNVDAAIQGVGVLDFQTPQPDDSRGDRIASRSIRLQDFAGPATIVEHGAGRKVISNFSRDLQ